jgi:hypothetical protein
MNISRIIVRYGLEDKDEYEPERELNPNTDSTRNAQLVTRLCVPRVKLHYQSFFYDQTGRSRPEAALV